MSNYFTRRDATPKFTYRNLPGHVDNPPYIITRFTSFIFYNNFFFKPTTRPPNNYQALSIHFIRYRTYLYFQTAPSPIHACVRACVREGRKQNIFVPFRLLFLQPTLQPTFCIHICHSNTRPWNSFQTAFFQSANKIVYNVVYNTVRIQIIDHSNTEHTTIWILN